MDPAPGGGEGEHPGHLSSSFLDSYLSKNVMLYAITHTAQSHDTHYIMIYHRGVTQSHSGVYLFSAPNICLFSDLNLCVQSRIRKDPGI